MREHVEPQCLLQQQELDCLDLGKATDESGYLVAYRSHHDRLGGTLRPKILQHGNTRTGILDQQAIRPPTDCAGDDRTEQLGIGQPGMTLSGHHSAQACQFP